MDALNRATYFYFDALNRNKGVIDALNQETYFEFDAVGNRTTVVDALNNTTYMYYDALNRNKGVIDALNQETYFEYDAVGNRTTVVDALNRATYFYFDALNRNKGIIDALNQETYFEYDKVGNRTTVVDALERATYFYFDALNRNKGVIDALNQETYFEYDAVGNRTTVVDTLERATYFYFDALNRNKGVIDALGDETYFVFDAVGNRTAVVNAIQNTTYFYFDALNRNKGIIDPLQHETYFVFDAVGNRTAIVDALQQPTYFYFDSLNRNKGVIDALGNETYFEFDAVSNLTTIVDPLNLITYMNYDEIYRLKNTQSPINALNYYTYDAIGNVTATTDPLQNTTYYDFDSLNRITSMKDPLERVNYYTYDEVSNLLSSQDDDFETTYFSYDDLNRQTKILYPDATFSYYAYDAVSNLTAMNSENGWTYFTFDNLNRPIEEKQPDGTTMTCTYDAIGRKTAVASAWSVYYDYDDANRMTQVTTLEEGTPQGWGNQTWGTSPYGGGSTSITPTSYEYNAVNNITKKVLGNNSFCYYKYDSANRVTKILHALDDGSPLVYFEYEYDAASRITNVARENGNQIYLEYDDDSRLTSERWLNSSHQELYAFTWDYDLAGNRIYQNKNGVETYFTYNSDNALVNKVANEQFVYYNYDRRGNCISIEENDGTNYFTYNHANLVTSIKYKSGVSNYFHYDSRLRRYALEDSDGLRYFTWDNSGTKLLDERDIDGNVTAYYTHGYSPIPGIGTMVAAKKNESSTAYFQFNACDHRGTVYRITDEDNNVTATYEYNAFGEPLQNEDNGATNRYRWQTNWISLKDSNDTILLSPSRFYSTEIGQFLQKDFLFQMTLLKQQGIYWNSIFKENTPFVQSQSDNSMFSKSFSLYENSLKQSTLSLKMNTFDTYGLYKAFGGNPYVYVDPMGLEKIIPESITYLIDCNCQELQLEMHQYRKADYAKYAIPTLLILMIESIQGIYDMLGDSNYNFGVSWLDELENRNDLRKNFKKLANFLGKTEFVVECADKNITSTIGYGSQGALAFGKQNRDGSITHTVRLYPIFWELIRDDYKESQKTQVSTLLHEFSHSALKTKDPIFYYMQYRNHNPQHTSDLLFDLNFEASAKTPDGTVEIKKKGSFRFDQDGGKMNSPLSDVEVYQYLYYHYVEIYKHK